MKRPAAIFALRVYKYGSDDRYHRMVSEKNEVGARCAATVPLQEQLKGIPLLQILKHRQIDTEQAASFETCKKVRDRRAVPEWAANEDEVGIGGWVGRS